MVQVTRFPFLFWGMRNEVDAYVDGNFIKKGEKTYNIKKSSKMIYIFAKYFLVFIGLFFVFTKYDFMPSFDKFLQYAVALVVSFLVLTLPKKYIIWLIVCLVLGVFVAIFASKVFFISFILKYFIAFFIFFGLLLDYKKDHYYILENDKIVANAIVGGE